MTATTPDEPTTPLIDAVAVILCKRDLRKSLTSSFDDIVAPGRALWMRYRYEARDLLDDFERAGFRLAPAVNISSPKSQSAPDFEIAPAVEPTPERWKAIIEGERARQIAKGYTREQDAKRGLRHLLNWAIDYARRGRVVESAALAYAALELIDNAAPTVEWVTTVEEVEALPYFAVCEDAFAAICIRRSTDRGFGDWRRITDAVPNGEHWHPPFLPARVLYRPEQGDES